MNKKILIEVCANSVESAIAAEKGGAFRVELCDNLYEGGTTPSPAAIELARKYLNIKLNVIIRPRGGDFLYTDLEFEIMKRDIEYAKELGADGIVFGILTVEGEVDIQRSKEIVELARPLSVTFHRAFDVTEDPIKALDDIIGLNIDRLLTSGQKNDVSDGLEFIAELVKRAADKIIIMPGAGIFVHNIAEIIKKTGAREFHLTGHSQKSSRMIYKKAEVFMGGLPQIPEFENSVTDPEKIRKVVAIARSFKK